MNLRRAHQDDQRLRITPAQINPTIGDIDGNIALMLAAAQKAHAEGADIVVFPELSLTAYYPADMLDEPNFIARLKVGIEKLKLVTRQTPGLRWVVGAPLPRPPEATGKRFYNGLMVLLDGVDSLSYAKQHLPTYGIYDERRHFEPGPDVARVFRVKGVQVGVLICEDGWDIDQRDYHVNPYGRLMDASPDLILSINGSPSNVGKREQRHRVFGEASAKLKIPLLYVNQVGGHDQIVYDGASFAVNAAGAVVFEADRFVSDVTTLSFYPLDGSFFAADGTSLPKVASAGLPTFEFYRRQIILGLRDYARRCGFKSVVVGCSGGIDSALTIALAAQALGAKNVLAVTMPSDFSSPGSVSDSEALCLNYGVSLIVDPIAEMVEAAQKAHEKATGKRFVGLALENLQARIRGTFLMGYSNERGHLLLTTGNKSEISVGYFTLYGDSNGGLNLIGDLFKMEVFGLSRHINELAGCEMIPWAIIEKPPSAELAPGQRDDDSLPPYPVLDDILRIEIEAGHLAADEAAQAQRTVDALNAQDGGALQLSIRRKIAFSEYKRRQSAPIIRVRGRAFGSGRQMPIAVVHF